MKRAADTQLTRETLSEEDDSPSEMPGPFKRASEEQLSKRNIRGLPKRLAGRGSASPAPSLSPAPSAPPLAGVSGSSSGSANTSKVPSLPALSNPFTFKPPPTTIAPNPFSLAKPTIPTSFGPSSMSKPGGSAAAPSFDFSFGASSATGSLAPKATSGSTLSAPGSTSGGFTLPPFGSTFTFGSKSSAGTSTTSGLATDPVSSKSKLTFGDISTSQPKGSKETEQAEAQKGMTNTAKAMSNIFSAVSGGNKSTLPMPEGKVVEPTKSKATSSTGTFGIGNSSKDKERLGGAPSNSGPQAGASLKSPLVFPPPAPNPFAAKSKPSPTVMTSPGSLPKPAVNGHTNPKASSSKPRRQPSPNEPEEEDLEGEYEGEDDMQDEDEFLDEEVEGLSFDSPEHQQYAAELKYWLHIRGLNQSFVREAQRMVKGDMFTDIAGLFEIYQSYRKDIEAEIQSAPFGKPTVEEPEQVNGDEKMHAGDEEVDEIEIIEIDDTDQEMSSPIKEKPPKKQKEKTPTPPEPPKMFTLPKVPTSFSFGGKTISSSTLSSDTSTLSGSSTAGAKTISAAPTFGGFSTGFKPSFSFSAADTSTASSNTMSSAQKPSPFGTTISGGASTLSASTNPFGATPIGSPSAGFSGPSMTTPAKQAGQGSTGTASSTFPGFGPITGGPAGSPFGTTASGSFFGVKPATSPLNPLNPTSSPAATMDGTTKSPTDKSPANSGIKPLTTWLGNTPGVGKPGGLFGIPPGSESAKGSFTFGLGAKPATDSDASIANTFSGASSNTALGAAATTPPGTSSTSSTAFRSHVTTGPTIDVLAPKAKEILMKSPLKDSSGDAARNEHKDIPQQDGDVTPKPANQTLGMPPATGPLSSRMGIANPWAPGSMFGAQPPGSITTAAAGSFTFGLGAKLPTAPITSNSTLGSSSFSFADPPPSFGKPATSIGFSFAEPPAGSKPTTTTFSNPFTSPPKPGSMFSGFGTSKPGGLFGTSSTSPFASFGTTTTANTGSSDSAAGTSTTTGLGAAGFGGPSSLTRGLSGTSTISAGGNSDKGATSSQETIGIKSQDSSTGAGISQSHDNDVAPEPGTGLALGEDKFDQPGPGEENEEALFTVRGKVMKFSGSAWVDMGIGKIRLYKHKETGAKRFFARNSKSGRIILNFIPFAKMEPKIDDAKATFMRMTAMDEGKLVKYLIKLKEENDAAALVEVLQKEVEALS